MLGPAMLLHEEETSALNGGILFKLSFHYILPPEKQHWWHGRAEQSRCVDCSSSIRWRSTERKPVPMDCGLFRLAPVPPAVKLVLLCLLVLIS